MSWVSTTASFSVSPDSMAVSMASSWVMSMKGSNLCWSLNFLMWTSWLESTPSTLEEVAFSSTSMGRSEALPLHEKPMAMSSGSKCRNKNDAQRQDILAFDTHMREKGLGLRKGKDSQDSQDRLSLVAVSRDPKRTVASTGRCRRAYILRVGSAPSREPCPNIPLRYLCTAQMTFLLWHLLLRAASF